VNPSSYPVPRPGYELHLTSEDCTLFRVIRQRNLPKYSLGLSDYGQWSLPHLAADYLIRCNGVTSHEAINAALNLPFRVAADRIGRYLADETGVIEFSNVPASDVPRVFVTGSFDSLAPLHMSVEITDTCNFFCDHCYVSASPFKLGRRDNTSMVALFDKLRSNGVKVLEVTGGECTTHPNFKEILTRAAEVFHLVAVVSNGYLLGTRDGLADWVASFDNVCVQISIDGKREFHDAFRKKAGSFDACCEAIRRLKRHGVIVRVAMSVTPENIEQVKDVYLLSKELGADAFSPAAITSFGRAANLGMCAEKDHVLQHGIARILAPYATDPLFVADRVSVETAQQDKAINCGAGWRSFALNGATGEVRSCLFLADSKKFGSVDREDYGEMFKSEYMRMFKNAPSPSSALETCSDCKYIATCNGCFAKAFRISETEYPECPWRHKYFPGMSLTAPPHAESAVGLRQSISLVE
jgi:radical SAM protein with 4Fe4S-binding SPASM domain